MYFSRLSICLLAMLPLFALQDALAGAGSYSEVTYDASMREGELALGVTYTLWIPDDVTTIRGVIVHQHGCGTGACKGGETAAYDMHWQALAKKWDCALLGPSYHQVEKQNCRLWCDPRNGSRKTFLRALDHFAQKTGHAELSSVPWCLWGHSGGGFWASLMQTSDPERIIAIWCRSGTAYSYWEKGEIPKPELSDAVYTVPVMCNPGQKEKEHERFQTAWNGCLSMFKDYRSHGAPIGFAPDPRTAHECGDSRYLAIPFFDACLGMRLPNTGADSKTLKPVDWSSAWLAKPLSHEAVPAAKYDGDPKSAVWLPNAAVAHDWEEYVQTGAVKDTTPPPAPTNVQVTTENQSNVITWDAPADLESGLRQFIILRNGDEIGRVPKEPAGRFGRPLFQSMSYHDTPEAPLPELKYVDSAAGPTSRQYEVIAINSAGLTSNPSGQ